MATKRKYGAVTTTTISRLPPKKRFRKGGSLRAKQPRISYPLDDELKFHDVVFDDAVIDVGGTVEDSIVKIPQGVTEVQRLGRKCTIRKIGWRYELILPEIDALATASSSDIVRVMLFHDSQANGATAAVLDILETANYQSFNNLVNKGRFNILMDKTLTLNYQTLASDGAGVVSSAMVTKSGTFFKSCNIPIEFNSTAGAITEIKSNNIGVLLISKNGLLALNSQFRIRFTG